MTSLCLKETPWQDVSFTGFVAMVVAIGTLMIYSLVTGYFKLRHFGMEFDGEVERNGNTDQATIEKGLHEEHVHVPTQARDGHAHGSIGSSWELPELIRHQVIS